MWYHGINFNPEWVKSFDSEQAFAESILNYDHWTQKGFSIEEETRQERLKELWRILNPEKVKKQKVKKSADDQQSTDGGRKD